MKCNYRGCRHTAVHHAYSTVGGGHIHACDRCAPAWLRDGRFVTGFYAPTMPAQTNDGLRQAFVDHIGRRLAERR